MKLSSLLEKEPVFSTGGDAGLYAWLKENINGDLEVANKQEATIYLSKVIAQRMGTYFLQSNTALFIEAFATGLGISDGIVSAKYWRERILPSIVADAG